MALEIADDVYVLDYYFDINLMKEGETSNGDEQNENITVEARILAKLPDGSGFLMITDIAAEEPYDKNYIIFSDKNFKVIDRIPVSEDDRSMRTDLKGISSPWTSLDSRYTGFFIKSFFARSLYMIIVDVKKHEIIIKEELIKGGNYDLRQAGSFYVDHTSSRIIFWYRNNCFMMRAPRFSLEKLTPLDNLRTKPKHICSYINSNRLLLVYPYHLIVYDMDSQKFIHRVNYRPSNIYNLLLPTVTQTLGDDFYIDFLGYVFKFDRDMNTSYYGYSPNFSYLNTIKNKYRISGADGQRIMFSRIEQAPQTLTSIVIIDDVKVGGEVIDTSKVKTMTAGLFDEESDNLTDISVLLKDTITDIPMKSTTIKIEYITKSSQIKVYNDQYQHESEQFKRAYVFFNLQPLIKVVPLIRTILKILSEKYPDMTYYPIAYAMVEYIVRVAYPEYTNKLINYLIDYGYRKKGAYDKMTLLEDLSSKL